MQTHCRPSRGRRYVIVNADDFGISQNVNKAIVEAFERSLISSATIMANMPAFEEACLLILRNNLNGKVGLHLNFSSGEPLSADISHFSKFCDGDGRWRSQRMVFVLNNEEKFALEAEIIAQVQACEQRGITLTHWDSHHHMHTTPGIAPVVIGLAKRLGVRAIRPALNCGPGREGTSVMRRSLAQSYRNLFNFYLKFNGLARTQYCGDVRHVEHLIRTTTANVEIMVHPMSNTQGQLVDSDGRNLTALMSTLAIPPVEMSTYEDVPN